MGLEKKAGWLERLLPSGYNPLAAKGPFDGSRLDLKNPDWFTPLVPFFRYLYDHYFRVSITGWENVPERPALYVANHCGGFVVPDMLMLGFAWWQRFGISRPLYGLAHDFLFSLGPMAKVFTYAGAVRGNMDTAQRVLSEARGNVLVYPGGAEEMFRSFGDRNKIQFQGRTGFIKLALRQQVPIIPVVTVGAHESFVVLWEGRELAKLLGLPRLFRLNVLPVHLNLPFGISFGPLPTLPLPVQIEIQLGEPIFFEGMTPEHADDPVAVQACYDRVVTTMQERLDRMAEGRPGTPLLNRLPTSWETLFPFLEKLRAQASPPASREEAATPASREEAGARASGSPEPGGSDDPRSAASGPDHT